MSFPNSNFRRKISFTRRYIYMLVYMLCILYELCFVWKVLNSHNMFGVFFLNSAGPMVLLCIEPPIDLTTESISTIRLYIERFSL